MILKRNRKIKPSQYLIDLLDSKWENEIKNCEDMDNLQESLKYGNIDEINNNIKNLALYAFKIGYNRGRYDGSKPYEDRKYKNLISLQNKQLEIIQKLIMELEENK